MKKLFTLLFIVLCVNIANAQIGVEKYCKQINYSTNEECPLTICITQEWQNCESPNECGINFEQSLQTCSKIEHLHTFPFSEICFYIPDPNCIPETADGCRLITTKVTISRGVLGETLQLSGTNAQLFTDIIFNNQPGFLNIGAFKYDCNGEEIYPFKTLLLSNQIGNGAYLSLQ